MADLLKALLRRFGLDSKDGNSSALCPDPTATDTGYANSTKHHTSMDKSIVETGQRGSKVAPVFRLYQRRTGAVLSCSHGCESKMADVVERPNYLPSKASGPVVGEKGGREYANEFAEEFVAWMQAKGMKSRWRADALWDIASRWFALEVGLAVPYQRNFLSALKKFPGVKTTPHVRVCLENGLVGKRTFYTLPIGEPTVASD